MVPNMPRISRGSRFSTGGVIENQEPKTTLRPTTYQLALTTHESAAVVGEIFPAGRAVVGHLRVAEGLDFVNFSAGNLEDVHGDVVEGLETQRLGSDARDADDLLGLLVHWMAKLREAHHQAVLRV